MASGQTLPQNSVVRPHLRSRRNPRLITLGVIAVCVGGLGTAMAYQQAGHTQSVIYVTKGVPRGQVVKADNLGVTTIGSAPGVSTLPASEMARLVGKEALVDLPRGALVGPGAVGEAQLTAGNVQLGLRLPAGRLPTTPMPAGTSLILVPLADKNQTDTSGLSKDYEAKVASAPVVLPDGATWILDITTSEKDAKTIAVLAANDRLVIVRKAGQ